MIEVEVKAKIENFDTMRKKLDELGAKKTKTESQEDLYFNSPIVDFAETDEALRIRTTISEDNHFRRRETHIHNLQRSKNKQ